MFKATPIKPKGRSSDFSRLPAAVTKGMRRAAEKIKEDYELTTKGWKRDVEFTIEQTGDYEYTISTTDEVWGFADEGTKPHVIEAKPGKLLRFGAGGKAKTTPGVLVSGPGSKGGAVVFRRRVRHPGTKARGFSKIIAKRWRRGVAPFVRDAIEEAMR
jgi:hypothetical protein